MDVIEEAKARTDHMVLYAIFKFIFNLFSIFNSFFTAYRLQKRRKNLRKKEKCQKEL